MSEDRRAERFGSRRSRGERGLLGWLGPGGARTSVGVFRRTRVWLAATAAISSLIGATIVLVFANFLIPTPDLEQESEIRLVNLITFAIYTSITIPLGVVWGTRRLGGMRDFLRDDRNPTPEELRGVLRGPMGVAWIAFVLWLGATIVFTAVNLYYDPALAIAVGTTVGLGGLASIAVAYLLSERMLRAASRQALERAGAPARPLVPGVTARSLITWLLGTAVPLFGLILIAIYTLSGDDVSRDQIAVSVLGLAGIAIVTGVIVVWLSARAVADPIASLREAVAEVGAGDYDAEVPVFDGGEIGLLQAGFNQMVAGLREREHIRETLGTYVDPDVAEHLLREGTAEGEEVDVTVLFLDVRDFTGFAERHPAPKVVATLNRLFEIAVPAVRARGGHIDKFIGDGLMAVFGAPKPEPEHARCALQAALEIVETVSALDGELEIGIGLNSGRVVAGSIGGEGRLEFSVIGDAVNVAARVEAATRRTGDPILVSEETAELLGDEYSLSERRGIELKGKSSAVCLYAPEASG